MDSRRKRRIEHGIDLLSLKEFDDGWHKCSYCDGKLIHKYDDEFSSCGCDLDKVREEVKRAEEEFINDTGRDVMGNIQKIYDNLIKELKK